MSEPKMPSPFEVWDIATDLRDRFGAEKVSIRIHRGGATGCVVTYETGTPEEDDDGERAANE